MKVSGNSVRSLSKVLKASGKSRNIRFVVALSNLSEGYLISLGFNEAAIAGDYIIPSSIGKFTEFNANGCVKVRKDLPKEPASVMFYGSSRDWHGGIHHSVRTRTMDKYPRENIPAPSENLEIIEVNNTLLVSSASLNLDDVDESRNIHVTNVMLECFSEFEIFDIDTNELVGPRLRRLQWDILPKGQYPWEKSREIISEVTKSLNEGDRRVIEHRMQVISDKNPDFLAIGRGGFNGYFVYGFTNKSVYVLESIHLDNATYIFDSDWEALSQLTKCEIINSDLPHQRIIHNTKWKQAVRCATNGF